MFEGRNQEHLTEEELLQLDKFVEMFESVISLQLYGEIENDENNEDDGSVKKQIQQTFKFPDGCVLETSSTLFTQLCEQFKTFYDQYKVKMIENAPGFHLQDFYTYLAEKKQHLEQNAPDLNPVQDLYAYFSEMKQLLEHNVNFSPLLSKGSAIAMATHEAIMNELKDTSKYLNDRKKALLEQLKSYRIILNQMRANKQYSSSLPSRQMADLLRKITQCNDALEKIESTARDAFLKASGCFNWKGALQKITNREPLRYAKYSRDPLLGVSTYPLIFHLFILLVTEGGLRLWMMLRGFKHLNIGITSYYYHPGTKNSFDAPIIFIHGIGAGLIYYIPLMEDLLQCGRPIFFPEIPYVTGFRTWFDPHSILTPTAVASTLSTMLATHGFTRATFVGHSYGTTWMSYMLHVAPNTVESVVFLDPICFCLYIPTLTKNFVYRQPDPNTISYCIRTDVIINWTIQRNFPWAKITLFAEEIPKNVPCVVSKRKLPSCSRSYKY